MPDIFSSLNDFKSWFDIEGLLGKKIEEEEKTIKIEGEEEEKTESETIIQKLHLILNPFMLRLVLFVV